MGEEYVKSIYWHSAYLTFMQNARLGESKAGIKIAGRNINNLRYADDTPTGRKWRGTKEPLDEGERRLKKLAWNWTVKS